jgi:ribose/xylose/arabinose/galactoside ABC-type transport system permease subunit
MEIAKADRLRQLRAVFGNQAISMLLILVLMWFLLSLLSPYFFTFSNLSEITLQTAVIGIIAAGQTLVILSGGIDLSVGSVFACSGIAGGLVFQTTGSLWLTLATTLVTGAVLGSLNGVVISWLRVPPFIATLGMLGIARGLALILSRGIPIFGLSKEYLWIGQGKIFDFVPVPTLILLAVFALVFFIARYTRFGRFTYAVGSNAEAATLSGISLRSVILGTYALSGLLSGVGAVIEAARLATIQPAGGNGYELLAIGAVVIGGTSLFGGEGNVIATLIGALIETTIRNGLNLLGVNAFWQYVVNGAVIIVAVAADQWRRRL